MERLMTGDKTSIYQSDPESKDYSKQWLSAASARPVKIQDQKAGRPRRPCQLCLGFQMEYAARLSGRKKTITGAYYEGDPRKLKTALL